MNAPDPFLFQATMLKRMDRLKELELSLRAAALGLSFSGEAIVIPFFGIHHRVTNDAVFDECGQAATPAVACLILEYLLQRPVIKPPMDAWITFREFPGAGPLMGHFTANTNKLIESHFAGAGDTLESACSGLTGKVARLSGADHCVELTPLPQFSMRIVFNDQDDDFPAQCTLRFQQSARDYLSMKSVAVAATWLAGRLVAQPRH